MYKCNISRYFRSITGSHTRDIHWSHMWPNSCAGGREAGRDSGGRKVVGWISWWKKDVKTSIDVEVTTADKRASLTIGPTSALRMRAQRPAGPHTTTMTTSSGDDVRRVTTATINAPLSYLKPGTDRNDYSEIISWPRLYPAQSP